jgi:2Fe-2S ferredoxin
MTKLIFIEHDGTRTEIDAPDGISVMQAALNNDIRGILADCGGACSCATCHGYINEEWAARIAPPADDEKAMLECAVHETAESRLTCQIKVSPALEGIEIRLPISQL